MPKNLILIRHAQAESQGIAVKDFERILLSTGMTDASRLGKKLLDREIKIEKIISSTAARAALTTELICEQFNYPFKKVIFNEDIYESSVRSLLAIVNSVEDNISSLIIVGHNPVISYFAEYVISEQMGSLPTAGAVSIDFEVESWKEVSASSGRIKFLEFPI